MTERSPFEKGQFICTEARPEGCRLIIGFPDAATANAAHDEVLKLVGHPRSKLESNLSPQ